MICKEADKIFSKNIETLRQWDSRLSQRVLSASEAGDIDLISSQSGAISLAIGNHTIHSKYDPIKEAKDWINFYLEKIEINDTFVIFGLGLGYHVIELARRKDAKIFVFEPRTDVLKTAFKCLDFSPYLGRITFITDKIVPFIKGKFAILKYKPSIKMYETYFLEIREKLEVLKRINSGLKIMVVGPIYGGSLPIARYCVSALENLGHRVEFVDNSIHEETFFHLKNVTKNREHVNYILHSFTDLLSEAFKARCCEFKPDFVLALAQAPINKGALSELRKYQVPTAMWFVEDFRLMTYWQELAPMYDYFFTIQKEPFFDKLESSGVKNFHYLPLAASTNFHKKLDLSAEDKENYASDVSFVGAGYYNRRKFFEGLTDLDFKIWGNEWDGATSLKKFIQRNGQRIDPEEIVKIFNATKVNINLHSSVHHEGVNPFGDFVNPRTFEIAACGAFQLVDYRSELPLLFELDKELVCFENLNDLRKKIFYYLKHEDEREDIARRAKDRILKEHTYEHRMEEMIDFLFERGLAFPGWNRGKDDIDNLLKKARPHKELWEFLSKYQDKVTELGLDDIIKDIQSGRGSLSRVEKIFLFANSVKDFYFPKIERSLE